ncbi:hypothetical protein [Aquabacterium sp.]|uniref:hypothetical protein n=1 Tax=Aquabacterium sp. TaxID=1872578 RepID=UPI0035AFD4EF
MISRTHAPRQPIPFGSRTTSHDAARSAVHHTTPHTHRVAAHGARGADIQAKYLGHGSLSVRSTLSGQFYRFVGHGDTLPIDSRDLLMMQRLPDLLISRV